MSDNGECHIPDEDHNVTTHCCESLEFCSVEQLLLFNCSTKKMPAKLNEDVLRPALIAYFRVGRLYSKIVTPDKVMQLQYLKQSLDAYQVCSRVVLGVTECAAVGRQAGWLAGMVAGRQVGWQSGWQGGRQAGRQPGFQAGWQSGCQAGRQAGRLCGREVGRLGVRPAGWLAGWQAGSVAARLACRLAG
jgi:hypothetical protein